MGGGCGKRINESEVVGAYEHKFENGKSETWTDGEKKEEGAWKIAEKEVLVVGKDFTAVFKIEPNGDLTMIGNSFTLHVLSPKFSLTEQVTLKKSN